MSSTPSIQAVLPHNSFDHSRQAPAPERVAAPASAGGSAADQEASAVSLSPEALARVRAEALAAVQAMDETSKIAAHDAALLSNLAQAQAAGIDITHPIFTDPSSRLDALGLASVALAGQTVPEKAMSILDAFYVVMRAPLHEIEPKSPPTDPIVRQMKLANIRESLLPPFATIQARQVIDAYLQRYLSMHPEVAPDEPADTYADIASDIAVNASTDVAPA